MALFDALKNSLLNRFSRAQLPTEVRSTNLAELQRDFLLGRDIQDWGGDQSPRSPFSSHGSTYACMTIISQAGSAVPYKMWEARPNVDGLPVQVFDDPLMNLLDDPYPGIYADRCQFVETIILYLEATGNAWIWPDAPTSKGLPRSLLALGSQHVAPVLDMSNGKFIRWQIKIGKNVIPVAGNDLIHMKYTDPESQNQILGIGPLQAAMKAIRTDMARQRFDEKFFQNGSSPSLKLTYSPPETRPDDVFLTEEQIRQIRQGIDDQWGGPRNIHKVAIVHGGMKLEELGISQREMDFIEGRKWARQEIASIFRIPVPLLNDFQYAGLGREGVDVAQRMLYENNIVPKLNRLSSVLQKSLVAKYSPGHVAGFDIDEIPAMREDMGEKATIAKQFFEMGWPINQINKVLDLGFEAVEWGDDWLIANNLVPARLVAGENASLAMAIGLGDPLGTVDQLHLEDQSEGATDEDLIDEPEEEAVEAKKPKPKAGAKSMKRSVRSARLSEQFEGMVIPLEHEFSRKMHRFFYDLRKEMLGKIRTSVKEAKRTSKRAFVDDLIDGIMFDVFKAQRTIEKFAALQYAKAIKVGVASAAATMGEDPIGLGSHEVKSLLDSRVIQIRNVPVTLEKKVRELLRTSLADTTFEGLSVTQQAAALQEATQEVMTLSASRANRIARTEMISVVNEARSLEYAEQGVEKHAWLSSQDEFVRPSHDIDGEIAVVGDPFSNGLRWPGDPLAGAEEVVHCRCCSVPVVDGQEE